MNNDSFLIEERDLELAREICKYIENPSVRNRAVANAIAGNIAEKYFVDAEIDAASGLHNIAFILNNLEIADIYINKCYIDVRLYFNESELCVPKSLFDKGIAPVAFMFIKLTPELSGGTVSGFVPSSEIDTSSDINGYYSIDESQLVSFYDIEPLLTDRQLPEYIDDIEQKIFAFLDGSLQDVNAFYQELITSKDAREKLAVAAKAQNIFNFISVAEPETSPISEGQSAGTESVEQDIVGESLSLDIEPSGDFNLDEPVELDTSIEPVQDLSADLDTIEPIGDMDTDLTAAEPIDAIETFDSAVEPMEDLTADTEEFSLEEADSSLGLEEFSAEEVTETDSSAEEPDVFADNTYEPEVQEQEFSVDDIGLISNDNSPADSEISEPIIQNSDIQDEPINNYTPVIDPDEDIENITEEITEYTSAAEVPVQETPSVQDNEEEAPAFDYSTATTPSINTIDEQVDMDNLENLLDNEPPQQPETEVSGAASPQIDTLFNQTQDETATEVAAIQKKQGSKLIPIVGVLALAGAIGYYSYTKFIAPANSVPELPSDISQQQPAAKPQQKAQEDAMPVETVESIEPAAPVDEAASVSIPEIEQNLDASILVSNLSVNWEVPSGYISNNTAKRYFLKLGKIIQLNLKTELLLLNKPPITNKIAVEIEYNKATKKFEVKGITESSGEKTVDELILKTVNNALNMNLRMNTTSFSNITGNPVLVIHL